MDEIAARAGRREEGAPAGRRWRRRIWLRVAVKKAITVAGLYACLTALLIVGLIGPWNSEEAVLHEKSRSTHKITRVVDGASGEDIEFNADDGIWDLSDSWISVYGRSRPFAHIEFRMGQRLLRRVIAGFNGQFEAYVEFPPRSYELRIIARDGDTRELIADQKFLIRFKNRGLAPAISMAYRIRETEQIWVAGHAPPKSSLTLRCEADGAYEELALPDADESGVFEGVVPFLGGTETTGITVRLTGADGQEQDSAPTYPVMVSEDQIPLRRNIFVEVSKDGGRLDAIVTLPKQHPHFFNLARGYISADVFFEAVCPDVSNIYQSRASITHDSEVAVVTVSFEIPDHFGQLNIHSNRRLPFPYLSLQETLEVDFGDHAPKWFDGVAPRERTAADAIWLGPMPFEEFDGVKIGWTPQDMSPSEPDEPPRPEERDEPAEVAAETAKEYAQKVQSRTQPTLRNLCLGAVQLIPFIGLVWLAGRRPFGNNTEWRCLATLALVLAPAYVWWLLDSLLLVFPGQIITHHFWAFSDWGRVNDSLEFFDATRNAVTLLIVLLFVTCSYLYPKLTTLTLDTPPRATDGVHRSNFRRAWLWLRVIVGISALLVLAIVDGWFVFSREWIQNPVDTLISGREFLGAYANLIGRENVSAVALASLLAAIGLRAALFGVGLLLVALHNTCVDEILPTMLHEWLAFPFGQASFALCSSLVLWLLLVLVAILAFPLVLHLIKCLTPFADDRRWTRRLGAAGIITVSLILYRVPATWSLLIAGLVFVTSLGWLLLRTAAGISLPVSGDNLSRGKGRLVLGICLVVAARLAWPEGDDLTFSRLFDLFAQIRGLYPCLLGLGVVWLMCRHAQVAGDIRFEPVRYDVAVFLFAVVLINSYATWLLFVPVPFLVAIALSRWRLFRSEGELQALATAVNDDSFNEKSQVDRFVSAASQPRFEVMQKALAKQLESGKLTPQQYSERLADFEEKVTTDSGPAQVGNGISVSEAVFSVGPPQGWKNIKTFVKFGFLVALFPVVVALYQHLPKMNSEYPYPLAGIATFILFSLFYWPLYAFFFGFYFTQIRGRNGLAKAFLFALCLTLPYAAWRVLNLQTAADFRPFLFWVAQVFVYCTLLGLFAGDYQVLRRHGYRFRQLKVVHNTPLLSTYASTIIAAVVTSVIGVLTGRLGNLMTSFLETILPSLPGTGG